MQRNFQNWSYRLPPENEMFSSSFFLFLKNRRRKKQGKIDAEEASKLELAVAINHCCQLNFGPNYKHLGKWKIAKLQSNFSRRVWFGKVRIFLQVVAQEVGGARQSATAKVRILLLLRYTELLFFLIC